MHSSLGRLRLSLLCCFNFRAFYQGLDPTQSCSEKCWIGCEAQDEDRAVWPPSSILLRPAAGESVRPNVLVSLFKMSSGLRYGGEKVQGDPISVYQYLLEGSKGGARPFSMMPRGKMRQQAQAEIRKFHLKIRRNIFTVKMVKYCNRLSREAVASPSLEIFKTRSWATCCDFEQGTWIRWPAEACSFQPQPYFDSMMCGQRRMVWKWWGKMDLASRVQFERRQP